jgi:fatty acid desaturase
MFHTSSKHRTSNKNSLLNIPKTFSYLRLFRFNSLIHQFYTSTNLSIHNTKGEKTRMKKLKMITKELLIANLITAFVITIVLTILVYLIFNIKILLFYIIFFIVLYLVTFFYQLYTIKPEQIKTLTGKVY